MQVRCPTCQEAVQVADEQSLAELSCASCGHGFSLAGDETLPPQEPLDRTIGHFRLVRQLGEGAFGTVWLARDQELDRSVALKVPRKGRLSPQETEQFLREARAAAQLKHPNIVAVHEVGRQSDQIYIVSDFVPGQSLGEWLRGRRPKPARAAELASKIATALDHAHAAGVIHRDLKPGNILLDEAGEPHIADFGLARRERVDITMTAEGSPLGTPAYMSPEQARGEAHQADRRTDVYSLGVILYELLTGEMPFRGNLRMMLHQVLHEEPPPPRRLDPNVPRDLETICLKCMEKDPPRRYETAGDVAAELRRFLAGEPIGARPVGRVEQLWRWSKRKPALAAVSGLALAGLLGVALVSVLLAFAEMRSARELAGEQARTAEALNASQRLAAELALDKGQLIGERGDVNLALLWMARALELVPAEADELEQAIRMNLNAWSQEAVQLQHVVDSGGPPEALAFSPDGQRLLMAGADGTRLHVRVVDARDGRTLRHFTHDGETSYTAAATKDLSRLLVGYTSGVVRLFDVESGKVIWELEKPGDVVGVQISPDQQNVLLGWLNARGREREGSTVQLHAITTGAPSGPALAHELAPYAMAFAPDGARFAVATAVWADDRFPGTIRIWDLEGKEWCPPLVQESVTVHMAFSQDGQQILSGHFDFAVRLCDVSPAPGAVPVQSVLWRQEAPVRRVAFHPEVGTRKALTACFDGTARLWDLETGEQIGPPLRHEMLLLELALMEDGTAFATGALDHTVRVWGMPQMTRDQRALTPLEAAPGRTFLLADDEQHRVVVRDIHGSAPVSVPLQHDGPVQLMSGALSPDGAVAATVGRDMIVHVWNLGTGRLVRSLPGQSFFASFSPDGRQLLVGNWNAAGVWDVASGQKLLHLPQAAAAGPTFSGAFSPNGTFIITGGADSSARLWDASTGALVAVFPHATAAASVAFSPDSRYAAVAGHEGTRVWDVQTHQPIGVMLRQDGFVFATAFSPDGRLLLTGANDGQASLWDLGTGKPLGPPVKHDSSIGRVGFLPDGRTAYAALGSAGVQGGQTAWQPPQTHFWEIPAPVEGESRAIRTWIESITGMTLDDDGGVHVLDAKAWRQRRDDAQVAASTQPARASSDASQ